LSEKVFGGFTAGIEDAASERSDASRRPERDRALYARLRKEFEGILREAPK
jgi:hypothetical protein